MFFVLQVADSPPVSLNFLCLSTVSLSPTGSLLWTSFLDHSLFHFILILIIHCQQRVMERYIYIIIPLIASNYLIT